ncbi:uncharacterized protein LOC133927455 isoform X2 [Phragmites australis]|uniref:uncharacterized protein LOC133927455 isoform X2 n=1 Tax=Phragmites australis TaxID=29695 RepID=UPI002D76E5B6|nr:uncharacterized protein LOC133927455 isoform X2 [Phragmites australis]XP_062229918.1 uncharacterized protein LOC133927455 isoform X2 [Phragmites australis]XP_062229919.1 uncharacterized protein LOC133927455 isoform X2 [Phragmites australis]XP_062229920.1 uncharacterized protein LOC133927455 isoform X2 [Phragmites australis]
MPCALEVIDTRLQSTAHIQCNTSFDQNIGNHFSKGQLIRKPFSVRPENRDTALTILPLGHDSHWNLGPFLSDIQEVSTVSSLTSGAPGTEGLELSSAQPRILYWLGQLNERNMHDQADSSKPVSNGNPHGRSTLRQSRHRRNVCNPSTAVPPCHVVAKKSSRPVTATLRSDSDILHDDDKPPKRSPKKKGNKKGKHYKRTTRKKLNLASEITCEENTYAVCPVEVLPTNWLADKLSETTSSASSLVKEAHLGKDDGGNNNDYVECGTILNLSTLGTNEMDGSECTGSSNDATGVRLSCSCVPNNGSNTTDSSEFDGSTFAEHGLGEESDSYQKLLCACVYNPEDTDSFFSRWNNDNSGNSVGVEARSTIKDEHRRDHLHPRPSTGLNNVRTECHLIGTHLTATHAEDTDDSFGHSSCCSKDVTDSSSHTERVQCSSEACNSKTSLQFNSGRRSRRSRKTPSYSDLSVSNRVVSANRHKNSGKDSSAVWQKVEKNDKTISKAGQTSESPIRDKSAQEDTNKGVQQDPTRHRAKHNQSTKACKQESPNETVEMESTKEEQDALNSCQTSSRPTYKKQAPFLRQQRSSSSKQGSQSSKNYYAPKNVIPKVPKDYLQQEGLPMLQLVHDKDTGDRPTSNSCSADEVILTGVGNCPTEGNESSQSGIEKAALASCISVPDLTPQAASIEAHISITLEDPHSLCPENKGSRNTDPCAAETEEAQCVKLTTKNNPQESCKLYSAAGHLSQNWVPVGKKEVFNVMHLEVSEASVVEGPVPANDICDSVCPASTNGEDSKLASEMTSKLNSSEHVDLKCQAYNGTETDYNKIREAISDVNTAQQRVEDIQLIIGRPLADFERFIYSASPAMHCSPCPTGCKSDLQECVKDSLCLHQTPDITLSSVWQWYEEPGCYGLEVRAQDFHRSKGLWNSRYQFTTYFVPYLSAVQLFGQPKITNGGSIAKEAINMDMTCETSPCLNSPPIFAKLMPRQSNPRNRSSTSHTEDDQQSASGELIFEFFESEQPYWRRQLVDKVNELIAGVKPLNCQISGDPKNLELSLNDLHPASWYCVAWYPIYRIPDGKFQAAFLTYHSLGHWIHRSSSADQAGHAPVVLPVVGLQSYNDKAEWWFQMSKGDSDDVESQSSEASQALKERLRKLNQAAAVMSRATMLKNDETSRNRHPDYEFFLSRYG